MTTQTQIIEERLAKLSDLKLRTGSHPSPEQGMCVMEAVAFVAGEPHSDSPECACPVISAFMRSWNDSLGDEPRNRLLAPYITKLVGTRSTPEVQEHRAWLATDWLVRVLTPAFLELSPALRESAAALSGLPPVLSRDSAEAVQPVLDRARKKAAAARTAAWTAARTAAWTAARTAAGDAARTAAGTAARTAAWTAAWTAARDAAWTAAGDAAWDALRPTVEKLQQSALELLDRMLAVTPETLV